ncbi:RagB/SusD family nutrient uptake outer membrane protein [Neolewinella lacunae]|uniref:RagB/SusD family nutrient uptake outer membrane protein n=1 Tax=Neolewinella lacunae TaxID=1517758 RepID=A0A923PKH2_9BACT|nr:RagB/SusD family nutrient uptake outer membrane protein [Neolewinella lacunae]MBC6995024.1 RagB/SusD family nutrient uptake outer membrane protein [Neolewinella lacunae]MDN3633205.1 RagB/SusD family nutrient uptake outer membrane protein [Neolewinella lacunae]
MKIRILAAAVAILLATFSCTEVLDRTPQGVYTLDNFFQTEDQAVQSVNAIYNQLRRWETHVFSYIGMTDIVSDDSEKGSFPSDGFFLQEVEDFEHTASNVAPSTVWAGYYDGVFRANLAIANLPEVPEMNENLRARLLAEARFLRAYYYFSLVRWFGDIPLILEPFPANFEIPRTAAAEVYAQIEADFQAAADVLPEKSAYPAADLGRATKGAALAMLARVALTRQEFQAAADYATAVIESDEYGLLTNYSQNFRRAGENGRESIFEVQATALEIGGAGSQYNEVQGVRGEPNLGWGFNRPSDNLIQAFEPGDPRREATILYVGEVLPDGSAIVEDNPNIVGERYNQKAFVEEHPGGNGNGPGNIRLFRYADLLLIAAEALNEIGQSAQALTYLNQVRARARGTNNRILPDVTTTDRDQLRNAIWHERRVELALEQQRWFDLVRTGRAATVMQALGKNFVPGKHELFPIPQGEIDLSQGALTQNPGY